MQTHLNGSPIAHLRHGAAQQHFGVRQRRLDGESVGHFDRPVSANVVRSEQAPVGRHVSAIQQSIRDHVVGRRHRQTVGPENGRFHSKLGRVGQWRLGWGGMADQGERDKVGVRGRQS